jgi:hypothetical protein
MKVIWLCFQVRVLIIDLAHVFWSRLRITLLYGVLLSGRKPYEGQDVESGRDGVPHWRSIMNQVVI